MMGSTAQMVALTCYGNAIIRSIETSRFFPDNSTCQFCESVTFIELPKSESDTEKEVAATPDEWFKELIEKDIEGLVLHHVGGGGGWIIQAILKNNVSQFWMPEWKVGDKNAPERKIWKVRYGMYSTAATFRKNARNLKDIKTDLEKALQDINTFAVSHNCRFTNCFTQAIEALHHPQADIGYHKDLSPLGLLNETATSLLKAAQSAWVFGGMGSWNDMVGFKEVEQKEYDRVSETLFQLLNEAIEAAVTSSMEKRIDYH